MKRIFYRYWHNYLKSVNKRLEKETPIFLFGSFRGGTTLLQRILNVTNNVAIWGEQGHFMDKIAEAYYTMFEDSSNRFLGKNEQIYQIFLGKSIKNPEKWVAWSNWYGVNKYKENYRKFVKSFYAPTVFGIKYWGFKEIRYGLHDRVLQFLIDIFPSARFIFLTRDPIDTLRSQMAFLKKSNCGTEEFNSLLEKWIKRWNKQNRNYFDFNAEYKNNSVIISYENIVSNRNSLSELFVFLKLKLTAKHYDILGLKKGRWMTRKDLKEKALTDKNVKTIKECTKEVASLFNY